MNKKAVILGVGLLAMVAAWFKRQELAALVQPDSTSAPAGYTPDYTPEPAPVQNWQEPGFMDGIDYWTNQNAMETQIITAPIPFIQVAPATDGISSNMRAFINMIAACEGTANAGGYATLYGSRPGNIKTFDGWADHPRLAQRISTTDRRWTSAAGLLQWMAISPIPGGGSTRLDTWDRMQKKLNLPDFSPESQDRAAVELFREFDALADIEAGRVLQAARKLKSQWASLPGAGYGQGERTESYVMAQYTQAGGALA